MSVFTHTGRAQYVVHTSPRNKPGNKYLTHAQLMEIPRHNLLQRQMHHHCFELGLQLTIDGAGLASPSTSSLEKRSSQDLQPRSGSGNLYYKLTPSTMFSSLTTGTLYTQMIIGWKYRQSFAASQCLRKKLRYVLKARRSKSLAILSNRDTISSDSGRSKTPFSYDGSRSHSVEGL